jgi:hypothetical protein
VADEPPPVIWARLSSQGRGPVLRGLYGKQILLTHVPFDLARLVFDLLQGGQRHFQLGRLQGLQEQARHRGIDTIATDELTGASPLLLVDLVAFVAGRGAVAGVAHTHPPAALAAQFTASGANTPVTWSVGLNSGTITSDGLYTAPPYMGMFLIKATSVTDPTKSATATVSVGGMGMM